MKPIELSNATDSLSAIKAASKVGQAIERLSGQRFPLFVTGGGPFFVQIDRPDVASYAEIEVGTEGVRLITHGMWCVLVPVPFFGVDDDSGAADVGGALVQGLERAEGPEVRASPDLPPAALARHNARQHPRGTCGGRCPSCMPTPCGDSFCFASCTMCAWAVPTKR